MPEAIQGPGRHSGISGKATHRLTNGRIETVEPDESRAVREFAALPERIYGARARCFGDVASNFLISGAALNPFLEDRQFQAFVVRTRRGVEARAIAVLDHRYRRHWSQKLGHIVMFEALEEARDAATVLLEHACEWLISRDCSAVRAGFGPLEPGFLIDSYDVMQPRMLRHTAPHYHSILKQAGFTVENGAAEYIIPVDRHSGRLFEASRRRAVEQGYDVVELASLDAAQRVADVAKTWNRAFSGHWGLAPVTSGEIDVLLRPTFSVDTLCLSALAYYNNEPVGVVLAMTDNCRDGRSPLFSRYSIRLANSFVVGVCEAHRGVGLAAAMASHTYLQLIARGARLLSYGLVLDDNLASRRSALKLGATVSSNYATYRSDH